ncbi:MAG TPA: bifunctional phosphopantothenoylcysteine decarboxylase/phosphopantothenate--cysteine ligase CoaBC [Acidimicrobiales bacterium]
MSGALSGRRVVLGVSGGIAAYKAVEVCRRLIEAGAHVAPVLTRGATRFVGTTTFDALASEPARTSMYGDPTDPIPHTRLGQTADVIVVVPATASVIGRFAAGISNDLLTATLLATRAPVVIAPAMHTEMWDHPAVQDNIATLRRRGTVVVPPAVGRLAGGDLGAGRLADPLDVVTAVAAAVGPRDLAGAKLLVTAGGTREPIDAVRYVGNRSSGKQGHAIAEAAAARGAEVVLITTTDRPAPGVTDRIQVETAAEMAEAVTAHSDRCDVVIMAAAVADFRPAAPSGRKLKKAAGAPPVHLEATVDILGELGQRKPAGQVLVGFAAETDDLEENAAAKLVAKQLDLVVANDVGADQAGFGHDTNAVTILRAGTEPQRVALAHKSEIANHVLDAVVAIRPLASSSQPDQEQSQ